MTSLHTLKNARGSFGEGFTQFRRAMRSACLGLMLSLSSSVAFADLSVS